jgi:ribonuclease HIII
MPVCPEHSGICVGMENIQKQTENNAQDIKTLSDAVIKLTMLVENINNPAPTKHNFWDIDTKKYALKLGFVLGLVIILALVGSNEITSLDVSKLIK